MPNWCSNFATFTGSESAIKRLTEVLEKCDADQSQGHDLIQQAGTTSNVDDSYMFHLFVNGRSKDSVNVQYDTKWSPNLSSLKKYCTFFKVSCFVDYEEPGMEIYGKCSIKNNGNTLDFEDCDMPRELLDKIQFDEDSEMYSYQDKEYESIYELVDMWRDGKI